MCNTDAALDSEAAVRIWNDVTQDQNPEDVMLAIARSKSTW